MSVAYLLVPCLLFSAFPDAKKKANIQLSMISISGNSRSAVALSETMFNSALTDGTEQKKTVANGEIVCVNVTTCNDVEMSRVD